MKHLKLLGLLLLALCAIGTALVGSASAAELLENLPELARKGEGKAIGVTKYFNLGATLLIECLTSKGTFEEATPKPPKGTYHLSFEGCTSKIEGLTVKCTGLGDTTTGVILSLGTWELVFDTNPLTGALNTADLFKSESNHFVCGGFVLVTTEGEVLCLHLNPTVKSKKHEFHCNVTAGGDPEETKYWDTEGKEHTIGGLFQTVCGKAREDAAQLGLGEVITTEEIFADQ